MTAHDREMLLGPAAVPAGGGDWWIVRAHVVGCLGMALGWGFSFPFWFSFLGADFEDRSLHLAISMFDYQECFRIRRTEWRRKREGAPV